MGLEKTAEILFNTSFFIYILTLITYSIILINKSKLFKTIGSIMLFTGLLFQTTGLALRWIEAGLSHPPMTNIYESLIFFAWGIVLVYLYFEKKYQINTIGILVIILVLVAMGLASLSPNRNIQPLVPALQSWWLPLHVFFASLSYALFLLSAIFAVLFIIKAQKIKMLIALLFDSFSLFCLLIVGGKSIFLLQPFSLNKVEFADGKIIHSPELISIPGINFLFLILAVFFAFGIIRLISKITTKKTATTKETIDPLSQTISLTCFILYAFSILWLIFVFYTMPGLSPASNPYSLGILILGFACSILQRILFIKYSFILNNLPSLNLLDQLSYQTIIISFPLLTLVIVTGSVWAHYAWGRYWGWDPKETWSLITWFIYALYLHLRFQKGWGGQKTALVSILGFFAVIFTYLGVNILLSGLHSYG